jgi:hypothetical protein
MRSDLFRIWGSHSGGYENIFRVESSWQTAAVPATCFLASFIFRRWNWARYIPPKRQLFYQRTTRRYIPEEATYIWLYVLQESKYSRIHNPHNLSLGDYMCVRGGRTKQQQKFNERGIWLVDMLNDKIAVDIHIYKSFNNRCEPVCKRVPNLVLLPVIWHPCWKQ